MATEEIIKHRDWMQLPVPVESADLFTTSPVLAKTPGGIVISPVTFGKRPCRFTVVTQGQTNFLEALELRGYYQARLYHKLYI